VVGEVRGPEALDMLQAMNTGHDGSMTTLHANRPRDVLARIETLVMMAGYDLPIRAIRSQITSAINVIVHLERLRDGTRKVVQVSEVTGMEEDVITMQDVFRFVRTGVDANGRVVGRISAHIDHLALAQPPAQGMGPGTGNWGMMEAEDEAVFQALIARAEDWLRAKGMQRSLGPFSLSVWDEVGLQVSGFDSMCGLPLCLVPPEERSQFSTVELAPGAGDGEFVKVEECASCAEAQRCFGVRRGYAELYGTAELRAIAGDCALEASPGAA